MILVTGAGGGVGSLVRHELHQAGVPFRAAYHAPEDAARAAAAGEDAVALDLGRPDTLPPALDGVDTVFLLGAMSPDQTAHELAMVDAAEALPVRRVVTLSVWRADEGLTPIAHLHRPVEQRLRVSPLRWTLLRPNFYMQNFSRQMGAAIGSGVLAQPACDAPISFVDTRDVAGVAAAVLRDDAYDGRILNLTGPEALTYGQAAEVFATVLARPVRYEALSDDEARAGMRRAGLTEFHVDALLGVAAAYRRGGAEAVTGTVRDVTGRAPTTLQEFAGDHRLAFQAP